MKGCLGIILTLGLCGLTAIQSLFSQTNLVQNGSFEDMGSAFVCNCGMLSAGYYGQAIIGWGTSTTSPDAFLSCTNPGSVCGTPGNFIGNQQAKDGLQYAGCFFSYNNRSPYFTPLIETMQGSLSEPLKPHQGYCIEFYASLAEVPNCFIDSFHIYFHKQDTFYISSSPTWLNSFELYSKAQTKISTGNFNDTLNWQMMIGGFTAEGGERKFILGNFKPNSQTKYKATFYGGQEIWGAGSTPDSTAYYYFDDFKVYECDQYGVGDHKIRLPNVFTPNGDGINDTYHIYDNLPDGFLFRVYNRWGECIYTDDNYKNTWSPQNISDGVYWVIAQNPSSGTWFKKAIHLFNGK